MVPEGKPEEEGFSITRDIKELKSFAWSLLTENPSNGAAVVLLLKLNDLDDDVSSSAEPHLPTNEALDDVKSALVDLMQVSSEVRSTACRYGLAYAIVCTAILKLLVLNPKY